MFKDRFRALLSGGPAGSTAPAGPSGGRLPPAAERGPSLSRQSPGLEQFFAGIRGQSGLSIIDLAGASQANVSFITNLGHRLYSEDFLPALDEALHKGGPEAGSDSRLAARFVDQNFPQAAAGFDGALLWDNLQFLPPVWLEAAITRLLEILRPQATLLAYFNADEKSATVPCYRYRIADERTLHLSPRGSRAPAQFFNNRALERLFGRFATTKFFLTRDHLREVLVRR